jgi:outer membrane protein assembly factor BamB
MRRLLLLLLSLNLAGCAAFDSMGDAFSGITDFIQGGEDNADPPRALEELHAEIEINTLWNESIGVGADGQTLKLVPAIDENKIFAADREGVVQARNAATGSLLWEVDTDLHFAGGPGLGAGTVVLGTSDAEVIALNSENGAVLWKSAVASEVLSVPVIANGIVVVRTTDGAVIAFNEKTGAKLWHYEIGVPALSLRGTGAPIVVGENLIDGYDNGKLIALQLSNGKTVWETPIAMPKGRSEIERLVDLDVDPIEAGGVIFIASYHGGVAAVQATDGEGLWRNETISSYSGLSNDFRYLYLSDTQSHVWQLEQRSGASLWKQQDLHQRGLTAPAVYSNYVVVGDYEGYVHWLSSTDGRQLGRVQVANSPIAVKPIVVAGVVYVYAQDGTLAALTVK